MTTQLTFQRGNYTGNWVEDEPAELSNPMGAVHGLPSSGSGSLQILYKGVEEIVLHDKAEYAAENVFTNYVTPDHHHIAEEIFYRFTARNVPMANGLEDLLEDDRYIQHDVHIVRQKLKSLLMEQGYTPSNFPEIDNE